MGVSFSISQRSILFPLEMGADAKAISVSGFTVVSLEPARSWAQMSVLYWLQRTFWVLSTSGHPYLLPKRPKIPQLGEQNIPWIAKAGDLFFGDRTSCSEVGEGRPRETGKVLKITPQVLSPGPRTLHATNELDPGLKQRYRLEIFYPFLPTMPAPNNKWTEYKRRRNCSKNRSTE